MIYLFFDMDGVLIDSMHYHTISWREAFHKYNIPVLDDELKLLGGVNFKETIEIVSKKYNVELTPEEKFQLYMHKKEVFNENHKVKLYDNVSEFLKKLKESNNYKIALVTGAIKELAELVVDEHFQNIFDTIVTGDDTHLGKPNPDPYLLAKEHLLANDGYVIEDSVMGIRAGKAAGLNVLAISTTLPKEHLKEADIVFDNHNDLYQYIEKLVEKTN